MNTVALLIYLSVMALTPGPNNLILAASGLNHGFGRTLPALLGISTGIALQAAIIILFMSERAPLLSGLKPALTLAGCAYLLYLAWQMKQAGALGSQDDEVKPMSFMGGIWFQWLNPKTWMMSLNMGMVFLPQDMPAGQAAVLFFALVFITMMPCISVWAGAGVALQRLLNTPRRMAWFNSAMATTLAGTALWLLLDNLSASRLAALPFSA